MKKENFVNLVEALRRQRDHDRECAGHLEKVFDGFPIYDNDSVITGVINFLRSELEDQDDWISHYIWETDFGRNELKVWFNGSEVPFKTPGDLWNVLQG